MQQVSKTKQVSLCVGPFTRKYTEKHREIYKLHEIFIILNEILWGKYENLHL